MTMLGGLFKLTSFLLCINAKEIQGKLCGKYSQEYILFLKGFSTECCLKKKVGNELYILVSEEDTTGYNCKDNCVYSPASAPEKRICFKTGKLPFECLKGKHLTKSAKYTNTFIGLSQSNRMKFGMKKC